MPVKIVNPRGRAEEDDPKGLQANRMVWFIVGFLEGVLVLRLMLGLLDGGEAGVFSQSLLGLTTPFVAPFLGAFPSVAGSEGIETASLVAMACYLLFGFGLTRTLRALEARARSAG